MSAPPPGLVRRVVVRFAAGAVVIAAVFFGTAGTLAYWQAWLYLLVLLVPVTMALAFFLRHDPALMERRLRGREPRPGQRAVVGATTVVLSLAFILPGLDRRFGWSQVPVAVVLAADLAGLLGYGLFLLVMRENRYASRTIEVEARQQVVTTGPYRVVRHPMYLAASVMYLAAPIALGSWWAVLPALLLPFVLAARVVDEEHMLAEELPGYRQYQSMTKYRLVPGIW
jgi:protein-S-isoprenylcysteine O-methyltransferase Ste14